MKTTQRRSSRAASKAPRSAASSRRARRAACRISARGRELPRSAPPRGRRPDRGASSGASGRRPGRAAASPRRARTSPPRAACSSRFATVHGGAGDEHLVAGACEHLAGVDADPDRSRSSAAGRARGSRPPPARPAARRPRAPGHAEHGQDRVADELLHGAAVPLDAGRAGGEVPSGAAHGRLGIEPFDQADESTSSAKRTVTVLRRCLDRWHGRRGVERGIVPQDRLLQLPQRRPGSSPSSSTSSRRASR